MFYYADHANMRATPKVKTLLALAQEARRYEINHGDVAKLSNPDLIEALESVVTQNADFGYADDESTARQPMVMAELLRRLNREG